MSQKIKEAKPRVRYIDNIKIFLTALVVLHHWAIANGAPGDWYYKENHLSEIGQLLMSMFVATNQAFFMGFFFFISAYFIPASFKKKGSKRFLTDRLKRLGIPLVFYYFILSPIVIFLVEKYSRGYEGNLIEFIGVGDGLFSPGPMWFVALLLIFSMLYSIFNSVFKSKSSNSQSFQFTNTHAIILFILLVVITFLVRIFASVGVWIPILSIQPAHLMQYIVCFVLGIVAYNINGLNLINYQASKRWLLAAQILIILIFPLMFMIFGGGENVQLFMGGFTYQSMLFTLWEQLVAVSLIIGLLGLFKHFMNKQSAITRDISKNAYGVYILHVVALVSLSLIVQSLEINSMYKFLILAIPGIIFSYLLAKLVRVVPIVARIV